jgi:hypothetical protein
MTPTTTEPDDHQWEEIIVQMQAFCRSFAHGKPWFRGPHTDIFLMGKTINDYVYEAIGRYLEKPEGYDPKKGTLIHYLEYYLLRSLVSNDLARKENKTSRDVYSRILVHDADDHSIAYQDRLLPFTEALFDDEIDYTTILPHIEAAVKKDKVCEEIFLGLTDGMKRAEIIDVFGMTAKDYDNGNKRLKTILRDIAERYDIQKPAL